MTARSVFDRELELLKLDIVKMGGMIEEAIEAAIRSFRDHDARAAKIVVENDDGIDDLEKQIEAKCLSLILRQQPVARDLRVISAALKIITDMERIGDQAADIADLAARSVGESNDEIAKYLMEMAEIATGMVRDAITSFVGDDLALVKKVKKTDDSVDDLFYKIKRNVVNILKDNQDEESNAIDLLMIAKYIERIADHAVNIGEWVEFSQTGKHKKRRIL